MWSRAGRFDEALSQFDATHGGDNVVLGGGGEIGFDCVVGAPAAEGHDDTGTDRFLNEEVVSPAAPEVVGGDASVVVIAGFVGGGRSRVFDPVLDGTLGGVDEWVVIGDVVLLDVTVDDCFDVAGEPGFSVLAVLILTGGVFAPDDLECEVLAVGHPGDVSRLDVEDFLDAKATVPHQSDCDFTLERGGHAREGLVLRPREPDIPGAVFVLLRSHCAFLCSIMHLNPVFRRDTGEITGS
jgi:hypothetical protein